MTNLKCLEEEFKEKIVVIVTTNSRLYTVKPSRENNKQWNHRRGTKWNTQKNIVDSKTPQEEIVTS